MYKVVKSDDNTGKCNPFLVCSRVQPEWQMHKREELRHASGRPIRFHDESDLTGPLVQPVLQRLQPASTGAIP